MSEKSAINKKRKKHTWISIFVIIVILPAVLAASRYFGNRKYYLCSILLIVLAMIPFLVSFEQRRPQAREIVTIAVMCAIAVASRTAFVMVPHFKPLVGIVMITGMAFGAEAGFLTGAVSGFVSNFLFGQGPWTPWQMFAFGFAGFVAGIAGRAGIMKADKKIRTAVFGGLVVFCMVGPLLDVCTLFTMSSAVTRETAVTVFLSGVPVNAIHALATFLTLFLLCRPIMEKLERIKIKYGMMEEDEV